MAHRGNWANNTGRTARIREHLQKYHTKEWEDTVVEKELKGWEAIVKQRSTETPRSDDLATPTNYADGGFTLEGFMKRLARFLVVDDQVSVSHQAISYFSHA